MDSDQRSAKDIRATVFAVDKAFIPDDVSLDNFDLWNSLSHLRLALEVEKSLGRRLETSEILCLKNLRGVQEILGNRIIDAED